MFGKRSRFAFSALLVTTLLALAVGCELLPIDPDSSREQAFEVHLQADFNEVPVRVLIDGEEVFRGDVSTNDRIGLATRIELKVPKGQHHIRVVVDRSEEAKQAFNLDQKLYIGVRYHEEAQLPNVPEGVVIDVLENTPIYY